MITVTCDVERWRESDGTVRYKLACVDSKSALPIDRTVDTNDLEIGVSIHGVRNVERLMRLFDLPSDYAGATGKTKIHIGLFGHIDIAILLGGDIESSIYLDLDQTLTNPSLFLQISVGDNLSGTDRADFEDWLRGNRHISNKTLWMEGVPSFGLVQRRL